MGWNENCNRYSFEYNPETETVFGIGKHVISVGYGNNEILYMAA